MVAIRVRPAPDAEARMRRLAALLLAHAARSATQAGDGEHPESR